MNKKLMLFQMASRLYEDIKFVTELNSTQIVDEDGAKAYNSLLHKVKSQFNLGEFEEDLAEWSPRTIKYKDALVAAGQLFAMVEALVGSEVRRELTPPPSHAPAPSPRMEPRAVPAAAPVPPAPPPDAPANPGPPPRAPLQNHQMAPHESQNSDFDDMDTELYGSDPIIRNEDGTIPFSLD